MNTDKLTQEEKEHIAKLYQSGSYTQEDLAWLYRVSRRTVYRALRACQVPRKYVRIDKPVIVPPKPIWVPPAPIVKPIHKFQTETESL